MAAPRGWNAQDDKDLIHLADSGFQLDSMAWALNRSRGTIRARLLELHWTPSVPATDRERAAADRPFGEPGTTAQVGPRKYLGY